MLDLAHDNYLRPNGLGGYIIRQSDLSAWSRCPLQKYYYDRARADADAPQPQALSATVYGTVIHYALMQMEQAIHEGRDDALEIAIRTFEHYWNPENISSIAEPVTQWLPRQTYGGLRERGRLVLRDTYDLIRKDATNCWVLALEYEFAVPIWLEGVPHTLTGTVDRLTIRRQSGKPYVGLDDWKSGKQPTYLRHNMQGTAYAYASTCPEFWTGWAESGKGALETFPPETIGRLEELFSSWGYKLHGGTHWEGPLASRRFRWINVKEVRFVDGGWRTERDYARLHLAIDGYVRSCEAGAYSLTTTGEICEYCPFKHTCGGIGLPHLNAGAP